MAGDPPGNESTKACPHCGSENRAAANFCKSCGEVIEDAEPSDDGGDEPAPRESIDECPSCGADLSRVPPDRLDDCPVCGGALPIGGDDEPQEEEPAGGSGSPDPGEAGGVGADGPDEGDPFEATGTGPDDPPGGSPDDDAFEDTSIVSDDPPGGSPDDGPASPSGAGAPPASDPDRSDDPPDQGRGSSGSGDRDGPVAPDPTPDDAGDDGPPGPSGVGGGSGPGGAGGGGSGIPDGPDAGGPGATGGGAGASGSGGGSDRSCPDCGADLSRVPQDQLSMCPVCGSQLPDEEEETVEETAEVTSTEDLEECPECGKDLTSIPEDMRFVCPQCRVDLEEAIESTGGGSDEGETDAATPGTEPPATGGNGGDGAGTTAGGAGSETGGTGGPSGGTGGPSGGPGDFPDPPAAGGGDPDAPATIGGDDPVPDDDSPGGPEPAATIGGPAGEDDRPSEVVFEVLGTDVRAGDGDEVGSEIRDAMVEGGLPEKKSKYVHREHVRIDREGEDFYVTKIGPNPLEVNGRAIDRDERVHIEDGDELTFSELVTAEIRIE